MFGNSREPVIVQAYLPAVRDGDKRVILLNGEPVGAVNRIQITERPVQISMLAAPQTQLTARQTICATIGPELKRRGLLFVGIDITII